ncbi:hypothetical protein RJ640_029732 [Escallonia rubra]|uniref:NADH dehydrogenase-like complex L n=1 Tax=Escallonia rubra TaxID=112253 RepID=A0AA88UVM2_9ASTE|nr:hypothetical protein RJ640_029732 [Escallonia rubra]
MFLHAINEVKAPGLAKSWFLPGLSKSRRVRWEMKARYGFYYFTKGIRNTKHTHTHTAEKMSSSLGFHIPKALPSLSPSKSRSPRLSIISSQVQSHNPKPDKKLGGISKKATDYSASKIPSLAIQVGALLATVAPPAFAVTGVNDEEDFTWVLIQLGISAFIYFLVVPPFIMNWLRTRWYRRNLFEMYLQFMFVFMFFPGILLWAPFVNFRKFPRDPSMKYPWATPQDTSQLEATYLKYPWAKPEDYDNLSL